mmetsp:Transcript_42729/g.65611  ORF Transcript_42729/g.65611 Transcript_42729/m.65611 type:complete len:340 (-) Transcript_42729:831-1850(-)
MLQVASLLVDNEFVEVLSDVGQRRALVHFVEELSSGSRAVGIEVGVVEHVVDSLLPQAVGLFGDSDVLDSFDGHELEGVEVAIVEEGSLRLVVVKSQVSVVFVVVFGSLVRDGEGQVLRVFMHVTRQHSLQFGVDERRVFSQVLRLQMLGVVVTEHMIGLPQHVVTLLHHLLLADAVHFNLETGVYLIEVGLAFAQVNEFGLLVVNDGFSIRVVSDLFSFEFAIFVPAQALLDQSLLFIEFLGLVLAHLSPHLVTAVEEEIVLVGEVSSDFDIVFPLKVIELVQVGLGHAHILEVVLIVVEALVQLLQVTGMVGSRLLEFGINLLVNFGVEGVLISQHV